MKVLIDFTQIPIKKAGVGMYAMSLIREISKVESLHKYFIVILNDDKEILELLFSNTNKFEIISVNKLFRKLIFRFFIEQFYLPFLIFKNKIDIIHSLHYSFPLVPIKVKKIVTLHDMTFFLYPEFHKKLQIVYFKFMIRASILCCDNIICVSQSTKDDVVKRFKLKEKIEDKLITIPLGTSFNVNLFDDKINISFLSKIGIVPKKYFLFIGTIEPRKNIKSIIQAYSKISNEEEVDYKLVIVGQKGWYYDDIFELVNELSLQDKIKFTGFISENEKIQLIYNSYFFIYPSFYEGFGIPVLEAMSFGIPCITSNISSMTEVAGNAGILIDPYSILEIYNAMILLIKNKSIYDNCAERSFFQSRKFTWEIMTAKTVELYK